jgi:uncharacterized protein (DUF1015 family)
MAVIHPFRALRYDSSLVPLADVVTQPYDKITPAMQERYYRAHPANLVRIILGKAEPGDDDSRNVYSRAAQYLRQWREQGVLRPDSEPSIYVYSQRFTAPGDAAEQERRGFIALGRIHEYPEGVVFRHEQTLAKPKADRLNLLRATRAHFCQLFMLYSDPKRALDALLNPAATPDIDVRDECGVRHRVWRVASSDAISRLRTLMADKKLIIADGHHRYETALAYRNERREESVRRVAAGVAASGAQPTPAPDGDVPFDNVMMTFVNMDDPGLVILPTHRVVSGLPGFDKDLMLRSLWGYFTAEKAPGPADVPQLVSALREAGRQGTAIDAVIGSETFLLRPRPGAADSILGSLSSRQRDLDVVQLHKVLLEHVLGISEEAIRQQQNVTYLRDPAEAVQQLRSGANVVFLMNPVRIEQVRDIAFAGEVLPQKSTDFYPKLLSGLTIYALD